MGHEMPGPAAPSGEGRARWSAKSLGVWTAVILLLAVGAALFVLDRRGRRVLAPWPGPTPAPAASLPALRPSDLSLGVRYDLDHLREHLEERVPTHFGDLDERRPHPDMPRVSYAVALDREPLSLRIQGDTVRVETVVRYQGQVWLDSPLGELRASCGIGGAAATPPRALVRLASPVSLRPDWKVESRVSVEQVRPFSDGDRDRCRVALGPLQMDMTNALLATAESRLRAVAQELDAVIAALDPRPGVQLAWARIQEPVRLAESVWLQIEPDSVRVGEIRTAPQDTGSLAVHVVLVGRPRIVIGPPPNPMDLPLPPLAAGAAGDRFEALLETRIEYATASRLAAGAIGGREFVVAGRTVRIGGVEIGPGGEGRLALGLDLEGALKGRIYLVGTPAFDPDAGVLLVPDLRFSVESRDILLRTAAWLVGGGFPERIRRAVRWDLSEPVRRVRDLAAGGLPRILGPGVRLEGVLGRFDVRTVAAGAEGIAIQTAVDGQLSIWVGAEGARSRPTAGSPSGPRPASAGGVSAFPGDLSAQQEPSFGSLVPCAVPLRWQVADVDPRFELDRVGAREAVEQAAALWERAAGRQLFVEDTLGGFGIHYEFDDRQASLRARQLLRSELEEADRDLTAQRRALGEIGERLDTARVELEARREALRQRLRTHDQEVRGWNQRGGAPEAVRVELERQRHALEIERRSVNRQTEEIQLLEERRRTAVESLNRNIWDRNWGAEEIQRRFPARIEESGRYWESVRSRNGEVVSVDREIRVFRFADRDELVVVLAHELGHALGLGHTDTAGAVMSPVAGLGGHGVGAGGVHESDLAMLRRRCPDL